MATISSSSGDAYSRRERIPETFSATEVPGCGTGEVEASDVDREFVPFRATRGSLPSVAKPLVCRPGRGLGRRTDSPNRWVVRRMPRPCIFREYQPWRACVHGRRTPPSPSVGPTSSIDILLMQGHPESAQGCHAHTCHPMPTGTGLKREALCTTLGRRPARSRATSHVRR